MSFIPIYRELEECDAIWTIAFGVINQECIEQEECFPRESIFVHAGDAELYLATILQKHFDAQLEANRSREQNGEQVIGFQWLSCETNYYTAEQIQGVIEDIGKVIELARGRQRQMIQTLFEPFTQGSGPVVTMDKVLFENEYDGLDEVLDFYSRMIKRLTNLVSEASAEDLITVHI